MTAERYSRDLAASLKYNAAWLPGSRVRLGTICMFREGVYQHFTEASTVRLNIAPLGPARSIQDIYHVSSDGTSVQFKSNGSTSDLVPSVPQANAGIGVKFSKSGSCVVLATDVTETQADMLPLRSQLIDLARLGQWDRDWAIVGTLVSARVATILVSNGEGSAIEFDLGIDSSFGGIEALNSGLRFSVARDHNMFTVIQGAGELTPLFRAWRIKRSLFVGPRKLVPQMAEGYTGDVLTMEDVLEPIDPTTV